MGKPDNSTDKPIPSGRLSAYRPILDGAVFALSLLGVLVVVHLWIQSGRGFDRGCLGFTDTAAVECVAVTQSDAGKMFGVSNVIWGLIFYLLLTGLGFAVVLARGGATALWKRVRAAAIAVGFGYSLYLVSVQYFQLGEYCVLCLMSASVVAALFLLQVMDWVTSGQAVGAGAGAGAVRLYSAFAVVTVVIAVGDVVYYQSVPESAPPSSGEMAEAIQGAEGDGECMYDPEKPIVENFRDMVSFSDPSRGSPEAPVTVIEFFDPNCPHCKTLQPVMEEVVARYGGEAWIVWRPFVLWQFSIPQVEALYIAAQEGKFFEMLEEQYARQRQGGIPVDELVAIAESIGMDGSLTRTRLERGLYRNIVMRQRQHAIDAGVTSVPALMINGRFVHRETRHLGCIGTLIQAAG